MKDTKYQFRLAVMRLSPKETAEWLKELRLEISTKKLDIQVWQPNLSKSMIIVESTKTDLFGIFIDKSNHKLN